MLFAFVADRHDGHSTDTLTIRKAPELTCASEAGDRQSLFSYCLKKLVYNGGRFSESGETSRLRPGFRQHFYARRFHRRSETHLGKQSGLPVFKSRLSGTY